MKIYKILDGIAFFFCVGVMLWLFFAKLIVEDKLLARKTEVKTIKAAELELETVKNRLLASNAERDVVRRILLFLPCNQIKQNWRVH